MVRIPKATPTPSENTPVDRRIVRHPQVQTPMELETAMGTAQHGKHVHLMLKIGIHQYPIKEPSLKLDHPGGSGCMHTMATPLPHDPVRGMEKMAGYFNAVRNSRRLDTLAVPTSHIQYPATGEKSSGRAGVTSFEPGKEGPDLGHAAAQRGRALLLAFLECFLKGQRINQVVLSWRVEQKHKTATCAASDFPGVAIILGQAPSRIPRAFAHRALPGLRSRFHHAGWGISVDLLGFSGQTAGWKSPFPFAVAAAPAPRTGFSTNRNSRRRRLCCLRPFGQLHPSDVRAPQSAHGPA